jgi:hypothetical protein
MKTEEDEAFDELARKQGAWGGGFKAKQAMAADKLQEPVHCQCFACKDGVIHASDCAVHNGPAYPAGPCDCGVMNDRQRLEAIVSVINKYLPPFGMHIMDAMSAIISLVDPLPAQPAQDVDYWIREATAARQAEMAMRRELEAQPAQEPVAWAVVGDGKFGKYEIGRETLTDIDSANYWISRGYKLVSIYTTPPQRPWVGLTEKDFSAINQSCLTKLQAATSAESILKEKNS